MNFEITSHFKRKYRKKIKKSRESIDKTIRTMLDNPHHPGLHSHKVQGTISIFESYVDDEARLTYEYGDNKIIFRTNCNHDEVLKNP